MSTYKVKVIPKRSMKEGSYIEVLDGDTNKSIAHISSVRKHIEESIPFSQRADVLAVFDNYETIMELYGDSTSLMKLTVRVPKETKDHIEDAYKKAEALNLKFNPLRAMIRGLNKEIARVLKNAGVEFEMPALAEDKPSKRTEGKKIFGKLVKRKGFYSTFLKLVEESFHKPVDKMEVKWLHLYAEGKAKPTFWAYSAAIEALALLGEDIFAMKVDHKTLVELWATYYVNEQFEKNVIISSFREKFNSSSEWDKLLEEFIDNVKEYTAE